jgi:hypothetical protein
MTLLDQIIAIIQTECPDVTVTTQRRLAARILSVPGLKPDPIAGPSAIEPDDERCVWERGGPDE